MKTRLMAAALAGVLLLPAMVALGQDDDAKVRRDLATVITLQGKPCGKVTQLKRNAENDYTVTCESGNRYRVRIGANDRVVIETLQ